MSLTKKQAHKMYTEAKKQFTGKNARIMGKYTGKIQEVFEHYTTGFVALIKCEDGREVIAIPEEIEVEMERTYILGYTCELETLLNAETV